MDKANAHFVTPNLMVGGDLDSLDEGLRLDQLRELVDEGVTHIVDVRLEWSDEDLVARHAPHIAYLYHGVDDAGQTIPDGWFDVGVDFILDALSDPDAIALAHCHMGINRGPSLGFAVLLAQGWDPIEALDAIRTARPIAFVAYAEDALAWHQRRTGVSGRQRRTDRHRLAEWRRANDLDVATVIRGIRSRGY
ncbi:MAG: dual specificity protein phosphatase family protein [Nocardioidaceae bacterium]